MLLHHSSTSLSYYSEHTHAHAHTLKVEVETAIRKHEQEQLIKWLTAQVIEAVKSKKVDLLWCIEVDTAVV